MNEVVLYAANWCRRYNNEHAQCRPLSALMFARQTLPTRWRQIFLNKKDAPALDARKILYLQLIKTLRIGTEINESMTRHVSEPRAEGS